MKVLYIHKKCVQLYKLQEGKCFYCQIKFEYQNLCRDHLNPIFKGGRQKSNVVLACGKCNSEKGHKTIYEYREFACKGLANYLKYLHRRFIKVYPNSKEQKKIDRSFNIINRCTFLLKNPEVIENVTTNHYTINYKEALRDLREDNKIVQYFYENNNLRQRAKKANLK